MLSPALSSFGCRLRGVLLCILAPLVSGHLIYVDRLPDKHYKELGDLNIGVILPVHQYSNGEFCGHDVRGLSLLQRMEAIAFAIHEVNRRQDLLPEHKLGFIMFDDCYKGTIALAQTLHFIGGHKARDCKPTTAYTHEHCSHDNGSLSLYDTVGLIGSETSTTTTQIANLYSSLGMPQVSYMATSSALRMRDRYSHFLRTLPSDSEQAKVIMSLMAHFNWTYVTLIYSEGEYGAQGFKNLKKEANSRKICFADIYEVKKSWSMGTYKRMLYKIYLNKNNKARVVIMFTEPNEAYNLLTIVKELQLDQKRTASSIIWVASESWGRHLQDFYYAHGSFSTMRRREVRFVAPPGLLSINIHTAPVPRFDDYFRSLRPQTKTGNPWMAEFWQQHFHCSPPDQPVDALPVCPRNTSFMDHDSYTHESYTPDRTVSLAMDAVYTFAHGLNDTMYSSRCAHAQTKHSRSRCATKYLSDFIGKVNFMGESGPVIYDRYGEVQREYWIHNVHFNTDNRSYSFKAVAKWNMTTRKIQMTSTPIKWFGNDEVPKSVCSTPCGVGERLLMQQEVCCWVCEACKGNQYTKNWLDRPRCYDCEPRTWPDEETRTMCVEVIPLYLRWHDNMGIVISTLTTIGLVSCLTVWIIFAINNNNPLIKASSRELSYLLLFGLVISYGIVYVFLLKPSDLVCITRQMGFSFCFTLMYSPLVTKTIRIYRIFDAGRRMDRRPACVSCKSQMGIAFNIILLHVVIIAVWTMSDKPVMHELGLDTKTPELLCQFSMGPFVTSVVYNGLLLIASVYSAFRTRKLPDNFNESKFIGFCVSSTVVIQMAFVPAFFAVGKAFYEVMFLSLSILATATLILVCIFVPKVYALYFVEQEYLHVSPKFMNKGGSRRLVDDNSAIHKSYGNLRDEARVLPALALCSDEDPTPSTEITETCQSCNGTIQVKVSPAPDSVKTIHRNMNGHAV